MVGTVQAQNVVSISSASGHPGDDVELSVTLNLSDPVTALQLEIPLPDHLNYVDGSAVLNATRMATSHQLSVSQAGGKLKLYVYSLSLEKIPGTSGQLLSFRLSLGKVPSVNELTPQVVLSNAQSQNLSTTIHSGQVTILCPQIQLSERNIHFGRVPIRSTYTHQIQVSNIGTEPLTLSAATTTNDHFQLTQTFPVTIPVGGQQQLAVTYSPIPYGDEECTITLQSNAINGNLPLYLDASPYSVNALTVSNAIGRSDEEVTISISMQNMEPIVAVQCTFQLPEALQYVEGSAQLNAARADANHQLSSLNSKPSTLNFYIHSTSNTPLLANDGELFTFRLRLNGTGGTYPLQMTQAILSNLQGVDMTSDIAGAEIRISAPRISVPQQVDFGNVPMEFPARKTITVSNTGETALTIQRIEFTNQIFTLDEATLPTIESGANKDITLICQPIGEGAFEGTMQIYSNDPENRMQTVALQGTAYPTNQLVLSGSTVDGHADQYAISLALQNSLPIVALQFDLHWSTAMQTSLSQLTLASRASNHKVTLSQPDDHTYRFFIYSMNNTPIAVGKGELLSIIYNKVDESFRYAGTTAILDNVILSTKEEQNRASAFTTSLQIVGLRGDANNDGAVTITDVVCIVSHLLEQNPTDFIPAHADVNNDGQVTIADIVGVIDIILQKQ